MSKVEKTMTAWIHEAGLYVSSAGLRDNAIKIAVNPKSGERARAEFARAVNSSATSVLTQLRQKREQKLKQSA